MEGVTQQHLLMENARLVAANDKLEQDLKAIKGELRAAREIRLLKDTLARQGMPPSEEAQRRISHLNDQIEKRDAACWTLQQKLADLEAEKRQLVDGLDACNNTIHDQQEKLRELRAERDDYDRVNRGLRDCIERNCTRINELIAEVADQKQHVKEWESLVNDKCQIIKEQWAYIERLKAEVHLHKGEGVGAVVEHDPKKDPIAGLKAAIQEPSVSWEELSRRTLTETVEAGIAHDEGLELADEEEDDDYADIGVTDPFSDDDPETCARLTPEAEVYEARIGRMRHALHHLVDTL